MIVLQGFGPNVMQRDVWELIICHKWGEAAYARLLLQTWEDTDAYL